MNSILMMFVDALLNKILLYFPNKLGFEYLDYF